jgi:N-acetyl-gamma-glutamyl-phosphate reductase
VDLGADFRLRDAAAWERTTAATHAGTWTYGLPELPGQRAAIAASDRVANTGCYAAAITLALAPLIAAGVARPTTWWSSPPPARPGRAGPPRRTCWPAR